MISSLKEKLFILSAPNVKNWFILDPGSLRKQPFLLALRRWGRFARRNVCDEGDTWGQLGCSWAAKAFKRWPCLRQETGTVLNYVTWYKWYCVAAHLDWLITFAPIFSASYWEVTWNLLCAGFPLIHRLHVIALSPVSFVGNTVWLWRERRLQRRLCRVVLSSLYGWLIMFCGQCIVIDSILLVSFSRVRILNLDNY